MHGYEIPLNIKEKLFRYYEFTGKYDKAENILYELIEEDSNYINEGIRFYIRLVSKSEDELKKGNLPKIEVNEGLTYLKEKLNGVI